MWHPDRAKLVKVRLHSRDLDRETPWAEDCGPAPAPAGARYVRLANVPFLHAKPTYGDVIVASPDEEGMLSWDDEGLPYEQVVDRIIEDGGRWAMVLDYELLDSASNTQAAFSALDVAGEEADIAVEGCFAPGPGRPGRAYLAVPASLDVDDVLTFLERQDLPMSMTLVHPLEEEGDE